MTDKIIIYKFLKSFDVKVNEHDFVIVDKIYKREYQTSEFSKLFLTVFDTYKTNDNRLPFEICQEWFDKQKRKHTKKIDDFLKNCQVKLGPRNWIIETKDGMTVTEEDIRKMFNDKIDSDFFEKYYTRWVSEKVLDESEKIMGVF
jgi:hypothetical protein